MDCPGDHSDDLALWPKILVPFDAREAISTDLAAKRADCSPRTIRYWCEVCGIGRKVGGRLKVSRVALQMKLEGDDEALALYHTGNRENPRVIAYFERFEIGDLIRKWRIARGPTKNLSGPAGFRSALPKAPPTE
jgi:hypothetical protein